MKNILKTVVLVGLFFLLLGVTNVYAEEMIDDVTITGMKTPEIGETVSDNIANIKVPEDANYTIEEIIWWGSEDGMYYYDMAADYQFEEGIYYYCSVTLRAKDGYDFPVDEENGYDYTGNLSTSDMGYELAQQYEPGLLDVFGEHFILSTEEETPVTPAEVTNEVTPPNTGVVTTSKNNDVIIYASILGLSVTGLFLKKKLFNN